MAKTCSGCGKGLRFGTKCHSCRSRSASRSSVVADTVPADSAPAALRFAVTRLLEPQMVFGVVDTLTGTLREVTNDPLDAADVCNRLNGDLVYALGKRWRAPV